MDRESSTTKRPSHITVKVRGKGLNQVPIDAYGNPLPPEDCIALRKMVEFADPKFAFPEVNPIELRQPNYKGSS